MKKVNKKGFILAETLVVTVFVVTLFIFIYRITVPSIGEYEMHNNYDDIDSVYYSNLYKQLVTRYANTDYIDEHLKNHTYLDMSDCSNTNIYSNNSYCQLIKDKICARSDDKIFITNYNIKDFKNETKTNDFFDSGTLSNFRDYLNTISNTEPFYSNISGGTDFVGKYRLFIVRTVVDADLSTSRRYSNIGIYTGINKKFLMGEKVVYNPGDGDKEFYVLKNSPSTDSDVTLILTTNIANSGVCFNISETSSIPTVLLDQLKIKTSDWTNVPYLTNYDYTSLSGYTINYNGYRARLLEKEDIIELLGCKEDDITCFDASKAFDVSTNNIPFISSNLDNTTGYWTADVVPNSDYYAWSIKSGRVSPTELSDCTNIGIRPVIVVDKTNVRRAG